MRALLLSLLLIATALTGQPVSATVVAPDCEHCAELLASDTRCDDANHACAQCLPASAIHSTAASCSTPRSDWQATDTRQRIPHASTAPPLPPPISRPS